MTIRTLPREPWRGSMLCGWQISYDSYSSAYCGERKAQGLAMCREHHRDWLDAYGDAPMAPGNALGDFKWAVRLLWEPWEGEDPVEATPEEIARYSAILDPVRGE